MKISINKTCPVCGKTFETYSAKKKYCSKACKYAVRLAYQRAYNLIYYRKHKSSRATFSKICPFCGKSFETTVSFKKYCSRNCHIKAKIERMRNNHIPFVTKTCAICGKSFETVFHNQKYCSDVCAYKAALQRSKAQYRKKLLDVLRK